jgi:hypothetical protein
MFENSFITCADQVQVQLKTETNELQNNYSTKSAFTERNIRQIHGVCLKNLTPSKFTRRNCKQNKHLQFCSFIELILFLGLLKNVFTLCYANLRV